MTRGNRREINRNLGDDVDTLVRHYSEFEWKQEIIEALPRQVPGMSRIERDVVFLRVANELEEAVNLDLLFYSNDRFQKKLALLFACTEIAYSLGYPKLAQDINEALAELNDAAMIENPAPGRAYSFNVTPRSLQKRLLPMLGHYLYRLKNKLINVINPRTAKSGQDSDRTGKAK